MIRDFLVKVAAYVDQRTPRERVLLFVTLSALLFFLFQLAVFAPLERRKEVTLAAVAQVEKENRAYSQQIEEKLAERSGDPNLENLRLKSRLDSMIDVLDSQIAGIVRGLIKPQEMTGVLQAILNQQGKLRLLSIENRPTSPLIPADKGEVSSGIYRHAVRMNFEGDFFATLEYLRKMQALPWSLYWDELSIETVKYPRARIELIVHTLSLSEGWIGV